MAWVIYPRSGRRRCTGCDRWFGYDLPHGGREPQYCPACRPVVKRDQARVRMQRMRQRRAAGVPATAPAPRAPDADTLRRVIDEDRRLSADD